MQEAVDVAVQLKYDRIREESTTANQQFLDSIDDGMKKIIKEKIDDQDPPPLELRDGGLKEEGQEGTRFSTSASKEAIALTDVFEKTCRLGRFVTGVPWVNKARRRGPNIFLTGFNILRTTFSYLAGKVLSLLFFENVQLGSAILAQQDPLRVVR
ncbi:hypothetical protein Tco_0064706 [Tanacetum coccineum]|uniref:Uncharacterized protein n=1 Tax=Tanacetum coccineum TaxID=301880 RepID=A0ABQ4WS90_9ASTR